MGNGTSNERGNGSSNQGKGLNEHCYNLGRDAVSGFGYGDARDIESDPTGDAFATAPCHYNKEAKEHYDQGVRDGMRDRGEKSVKQVRYTPSMAPDGRPWSEKGSWWSEGSGARYTIKRPGRDN